MKLSEEEKLKRYPLQEELIMKNAFTLFDIKDLVRAFGNASIASDCLASFLNCFEFETVYETEDDSLVFEAGGENEISIEFFNFNNPLTRTFSIMYREFEMYKILYSEDLMMNIA